MNKAALPYVDRMRLAVLCCALALSACVGQPPNTAVPEAEAHKVAGTLEHDTPLAAIVRAHDIRPIDPAAPQPLLAQVERELAKTDPQGRYRGVTYELTAGNALARGWLLQTPDIWGQSAAAIRPDVSLPQRIRRLIEGARSSVDIAALQPAPDGAFLDAMRQGIAALARSKRRIDVRMLIGTYPVGDTVDAPAFLRELAREAHAVPGSRVNIHVGAMRSCLGLEKCDSFTWNHAKIVAVDGVAAIVGGHNYWSRDYLEVEPVHDLSLELRGPAAASASRFVDALWGFVCHRTRRDGNGTVQVASLRPGDTEIGSDCLESVKLAPANSRGGASVLAVARLGAGITKDFANQNDLARDLLLGAARRSIFIVQQDFGFTLGRPDTLYPESTLERLADFLLADQGDLFIVLSNLNAKSPSGMDYSNGVTLETLARKIAAVARARDGARGSAHDGRSLAELLCRRLHLAPLRFGPDASWPKDHPITNHAKFFMVDERAFYIGSDNFYPVNLQEFGYMIEDRRAAAELKRAYWEPLWRWSSAAAVSGSGARACVLRDKVAAR